MTVTELQLAEWEQEAPTVATERDPRRRIDYCLTVVPDLCRSLREAAKESDRLKKSVESSAAVAKTASSNFGAVQETAKQQAVTIRDQAQVVEEMKRRVRDLLSDLSLSKLNNEALRANMLKHEERAAEVEAESRVAKDAIEEANIAEKAAREAVVSAAKRKFASVKKLLTVYHACFERVTEQTHVVITGADVVAVKHVCHRPNRPDKEQELRFMQPTHIANPAAYCTMCDILYLGIDKLPELE
jgi:hypothetical protein